MQNENAIPGNETIESTICRTWNEPSYNSKRTVSYEQMSYKFYDIQTRQQRNNFIYVIIFIHIYIYKIVSVNNHIYLFAISFRQSFTGFYHFYLLQSKAILVPLSHMIIISRFTIFMLSFCRYRRLSFIDIYRHNC